MSSALNALDRSAYQFYHQSHPHPPMGEAQYISISMLTSATADDLLWAMRDSNGGNVPPYYTARGDSMAGGAFGRSTHQEIRFVAPIRSHPGRVKAGHCDSIHICTDNDHVAVGEHKVYGYVTDHHIDKAYRQGLEYLAVAWATRGQTCMPASWAPEGSPSFIWPEGALPEGVIVVAASDSQAIERRVKFAVTVRDCERAFDYYEAKAAACWDAYDNDAERVDWDNESEMVLGPLGDGDIMPVYDIVTKLKATDRMIKDLQSTKQRLEAQAALAARQRECHVGSAGVAIGKGRSQRRVSVKDVERLAAQVTDAEVRKAILSVIKDNDPTDRVYTWIDPVEVH